MKRLQLIAALLATTFAATAYATIPTGEMRKYRITAHNVTAGNVLSPFLAVVTDGRTPVFEVGKPASPGLAALAETGSTAGLEAELAGKMGIVHTAKVEGGPLTAATSRSVDIELSTTAVKQGAKLDVLAMIGKSNDSFIALPSVTLDYVVQPRLVQAINFDAGSEENSGVVADFGPGGHPTAAAEGHVSYDRGLNPRGDAPDLIAWGSVAALITVERLQ